MALLGVRNLLSQTLSVTIYATSTFTLNTLSACKGISILKLITALIVLRKVQSDYTRLSQNRRNVVVQVLCKFLVNLVCSNRS